MDYAAFVDFVRDNKDLVVLGLSLLTSVTGVGLWRTAYNTFRVSRWSVRKVAGAYAARCEAKEKRKTDALLVLVNAALQRELDARTAPSLPNAVNCICYNCSGDNVNCPIHGKGATRFDGQEIDRTCLGR